MGNSNKKYGLGLSHILLNIWLLSKIHKKYDLLIKENWRIYYEKSQIT